MNAGGVLQKEQLAHVEVVKNPFLSDVTVGFVSGSFVVLQKRTINISRWIPNPTNAT